MRFSIKTKIVLGILLFGLAGGYLFFREGTLSVDKNDKTPRIFVIRPGDGLNVIINRLKEQNLIRNRIVFFAIVYQLGIDKKIQAGDFRLFSSMDAFEIAKNLTHGTLDKWVTILEGWRKEEIAERISKDFEIPEIEFTQEAPEGYLFPDTYLIPKDATTDTVISILTNTFENKFSPLEVKRKKLGLTKNQTVTLASLVERESKFDSERQKIASVLLKRYQEGIPLQVDATVQYVMGYDTRKKTWWPVPLREDLKINSPYNTYLNIGLPPGPISNPGFASLEAVVNADPETPYLFYIHDKKGRIHFARDGEEHERNIKKYLK